MPKISLALLFSQRRQIVPKVFCCVARIQRHATSRRDASRRLRRPGVRPSILRPPRVDCRVPGAIRSIGGLAAQRLGTFLIPRSSHYKHNINYQFHPGASATYVAAAPTPTPLLFARATPRHHHRQPHCSRLRSSLSSSASRWLGIFNWDYCSTALSFIQMILAEPFKH